MFLTNGPGKKLFTGASSELGSIKTNPVRSNNGSSGVKGLLDNSKLIALTPKLLVFTMIAGLLVFKTSVDLGEWDRAC